MQPTSRADPQTRELGVRAGFSMLEAVIALAILALLAGLTLPYVAGAVDRMATRTAFQELDAGLMRLRGEAFAADAMVAFTAEQAGLSPDWSLRSSAPLVVSADGTCPTATLELWRGGRLRARLVPSASPCRYLRAS